MIEALDNMKRYGSVGIILLSIFAIMFSGIFFGISYFIMDTVHTAFESTDCVIDNNLYVDDCQDLWEMSLYPFLELNDILIWFSFFFIFALVMGMLVLGYQSGRSPVLMGVLVILTAVITYIGIEVSNVYRTLIENDLLRSMLVDFTVYNKIMLNFPWFMFIVTLFSFIMGLVNWQRTKVNKDSEEFNY